MYPTDRFLKIDRAPVVAASDAADELLEIFKMYPQKMVVMNTWRIYAVR